MEVLEHVPPQSAIATAGGVPAEPALLAAVRALADGPLAVARFDGEGDADRQTLALVAAGLATLVGAAILRFVTAAARP